MPVRLHSGVAVLDSTVPVVKEERCTSPLKLLFYGESPLNPTGFGNVNKHLLAACARVADVTLVASTHYHEDYDHNEYPYEIIGCELVPVEQRVQEHQRNLENIKKHINDLESWDCFFYQGDMGWNNDLLQMVGEIQKEHPEKNSIFYMPIDGDVSVDFAFAPFTWCSVPVVYTEHAKSVIAKFAPDVAKNTSVMWLGTEPDVFYPLSTEEKRAARLEIFGEQFLDRFLVLNVNRNQPRKDLARCMALFHKFHEKHNDASLYMHSVLIDAGGSLSFQAQMVGCEVSKTPAEIIFSSLDLAHPYPREALNRIYNAVDCLVSTAHGEGWGLTTTEAMAAGTPVVVPWGTANLDILGENQERGWGVKTGGDLDHTVFVYQNGSSLASIVHSDSFLEQLEHVYTHRDEAQAKALEARKWAENNSWERRESEWVQLLQMMKNEQPLQSTTIA